MKQKFTLEHKDVNKLSALGEIIISKFSEEIGNDVNFDPGNLDDPETILPPRLPNLQFVCPNDLSGEIIMLCIRLPGLKMDFKSIENI